jgi:hypothetical protein
MEEKIRDKRKISPQEELNQFHPSKIRPLPKY